MNTWDEHWLDRIGDDGGIHMNPGKFRRLTSWLSIRDDLAVLRKLDIGCGVGMHVRVMANVNKEWVDNYLGVDLSASAVEIAVSFGLNAVHADVLTISELDRPIQLFLLLDTLEHIEDLFATAKQIRRLGDPGGYIVLGNVPLYFTDHGEGGLFERPVDISVVSNFLNACGINEFSNRIYGVHGYPYMFFEGKTENGNNGG